MRVAVDADRCVAAGRCVLRVPGVFDQRDEDGVVVLLAEEPPAAQESVVREAARLCPASAITVVD